MNRFNSEGILILMSGMPMFFSFFIPHLFGICVALALHTVETLLKFARREG